MELCAQAAPEEAACMDVCVNQRMCGGGVRWSDGLTSCWMERLGACGAAMLVGLEEASVWLARFVSWETACPRSASI